MQGYTAGHFHFLLSQRMTPSYVDSPAIQSLSDDVIGNVRQRVLPAHRRLPDAAKGVNSFQSNVAQQTILRDWSSSKESSTCIKPSSVLKAKPSPPTSVYSAKIYPGVNVDEHKSQSTNDRELSFFDPENLDVGQHLVLEQDDETVNEHRPKRIRLNQARYRKKLENKRKELENKIREVEDQIEHLENERKQILSGVSMQKSVWDAAVMYLRVFRRGFHAPKGTGIRDMAELKLSIASDVAFNGGIGLHELVNNWRTFTQYFPDVCIDLKNLKQITKDSILATTTISLTVSQLSIRSAFPYLSDSNRGLILSEKLQGQKLILHGSTRFDWDNTIHRVTSIQIQTDMISTLLHLLGNLEDVSRVLTVADLSSIV